MLNLVYYYAVHVYNGDIQYGYTYDDGSYGYYVGQTTHFGLEIGFPWEYHVYEIVPEAEGTHGYNYTNLYYDAETDSLVDTVLGSRGDAAGQSGIGSGYDYADLNSNGLGDESERFSNSYEAYVPTVVDTVYKYYAYNSASGDLYYGSVYDDGAYGYYEGYSASYDAENGGTWTYYIYDSYRSAYDATISGYNYVTYYYDGETGHSGAPHLFAGGHNGLRSEFGHVDLGGVSDYFGYGYYEADAPAADDTIYYYYAYNTFSGDTYYGYVYDDGTYGYHEGYYSYHPAENGGNWLYYVYDSDYLGYASLAVGDNYVTSYLDGETGASSTPLYYANGMVSGDDGLTSEFDYAYLGGTYDYFGYGDYEADASVFYDTIYYYYAYNTASGDIYYGFVYDDGIYGYYEGFSTSIYGADDDGSGYWYYYVYDSAALGYDSEAQGYNFVSSYYDGETGLMDTPYYYGVGYASGFDGLGSELDYVDFGTGTNDHFGYGYHEADASVTDTVYYYYAYNTASGDTYYGFVYDDGTYGYYEEYAAYYAAENGGSWLYYIYDSAGLGYDSTETGDNYVTSYYDGETGASVMPYYHANGMVSGNDGLTSEFEYAYLGGAYDYFGLGYYEADAPLA